MVQRTEISLNKNNMDLDKKTLVIYIQQSIKNRTRRDTKDRQKPFFVKL